MRPLASLLLNLSLGASLGAAPIDLLTRKSPSPGSRPTVELELVADKTGLAPGQTIELAIAFTVEPDWHIYWKNPGEGGKEPTFTWELPAGFEVGSLRWPVPHRFIDKSIDSETFVLTGKPVILTRLKAPATATVGSQVEIKLKANWLVCKQICVQGEKHVSLKVPMVAASEAKPANERLFKAAYSHLPAPVGQAKYLSLDVVANTQKIQPGVPLSLAVVMNIQDDHHVNSHTPLSDLLTATDLFHEEARPLYISRPSFRPGALSPSRGRRSPFIAARHPCFCESSPMKRSAKATSAWAGLSGTRRAASDSVTLPWARSGADAARRASRRDGGCEPEVEVATRCGHQPGRAGQAVHRLDAGHYGESIGASVRAFPLDFAPPASDENERDVAGAVQVLLLKLGVAGYLLMALLGGFLLNLMPCVLPVISIKILSFVQQAKEDRVRVLTLGLAFSGGILLSFVALGVLIVLAGQRWGGLFQSPYAVLVIAAIVTAFALSLFGVFALQPPRLVTHLGERVHQEGHVNAFGMGLLATALGTACTAPFLGLVLALAAQQRPVIGLLIFLFAGMGMAFPYVILAAKPGWLKIIPRPGPWMGTFEHLMGFLLLGTVAWLLYSLRQQIGGEGLFWAIVFLLAVAMGAWMWGRAEFQISVVRQVGYYAGALVCVGLGWFVAFSGETSIPRLLAHEQHLRRLRAMEEDFVVNWNSGSFPWKTYTREKAIEAVASGHTVFVDYTASYCLNCKSNERLVIDTPEVREAMKNLGVIPFQADFSSGDQEIAEDLQKFGRSGVPMYLVIPAGKPDDVRLLDEILTKSSVLEALALAGASRPGSPLAMTSEESDGFSPRHRGGDALDRKPARDMP